MIVEPFTIRVEDSAIADLHARLDRTRWPDRIEGVGWDEGADVAYMQALCDYWRHAFDWRAAEAALNRFSQFRADVDGLRVHFVHERGRGPRPFPLVITHGWPGSFVEMTKILPLLTDPAAHGGDPADAFDVVVPSMPGYGFSARPRETGVGVWSIAGMWARLMSGLGYDRFGAQGGDFGAGVSTILGLRHAEGTVAVHLNYIPGSYRPHVAPGDTLHAEEEQFLRDADVWYQAEGGYAHVQRTVPQTLAFALADSPAGLAAWIVEKFQRWGDCDGEVERRFSKEDLLTNATIYWVTQTIHSSMRLYVEGRKAPLHFRDGDFVGVPCAVARFPRESPFPPRRWIARGYNIVRWTDMPSGGHFAALEEPALLAEDIRAFFRRLR